MSRSADIYAKSLYSLAVEDGLTAEILQEMQTVRDIFSSEPDFVMLLSASNIPKEERTGMLDACLRGKVQPYLLNFLKILIENGLIRSFDACCKAYAALYNEDNGIIVVSVVTAMPLTEEQKVRLKEKLDQRTGKNVSLNCTVDSECLGGIRIDYNDQRIDGTVANRLSAVSELLKNTAF